jgi:hypothetical protein
VLPGDIIATVQGTISSHQRQGRDYLHVDTLNIDLDIKTVRMLVKKVFNNNRILSKYFKTRYVAEPAQSTLPIVTITSSNSKDGFQRLDPSTFAFI